MNDRQLCNQIMRDINEDRFWDKGVDTEHLFGHHHVGARTSVLCDRVLSRVPDAGTFENEETARFIAQEALTFNVDSIVAWVHDATDQNEKKAVLFSMDVDAYDDLGYDPHKTGRGPRPSDIALRNRVVHMGPETHGDVTAWHMREYYTNRSNLVFAYDTTSPYGFTLTTAYPTIKSASRLRDKSSALYVTPTDMRQAIRGTFKWDASSTQTMSELLSLVTTGCSADLDRALDLPAPDYSRDPEHVFGY